MKSLFFILSFLFCQHAVAVSAIHQTEQKIAQLESQLLTQGTRQSEQQEKLIGNREDLKSLREQLAEAEREQIAAQAAAAQSTEQTVQMEAELVTIRVNRLQSRVARYEKRQVKIREKLKGVEQTLATLEEERDTLKARLTWLEKSERDILLKEKALKEKSLKEKLVKEQATKEKVEAEKLAKAQQTISPVNVKPVVMVDKNAADTSLVSQAQVNQAQIKQIPASNASWPYLSEASQADIHYAKQRLQQLAQLRAQNAQGDAPIETVEVINRRSFGSEDMQYLGDKLYGLEASLRSGRQSFVLFDQEFWHTIAKSDDGQNFKIIFDVSSLSNPQLYLFKQDLLK